jgi:hypothetical protein
VDCVKGGGELPLELIPPHVWPFFTNMMDFLYCVFHQHYIVGLCSLVMLHNPTSHLSGLHAALFSIQQFHYQERSSLRAYMANASPLRGAILMYSSIKSGHGVRSSKWLGQQIYFKDTTSRPGIWHKQFKKVGIQLIHLVSVVNFSGFAASDKVFDFLLNKSWVLGC